MRNVVTNRMNNGERSIGSDEGRGDEGTMGDTSGDAIRARSETMEESW
jgi:hypothetical protein